MKIKITIIDDTGKSFAGECELSSIKSTSGRRGSAPKSQVQSSTKSTLDSKIDFSLHIRAFAKKFISAKTSGPQKFALLLARMANGNVSNEVSVLELQKQWDKMKSLLGGKYNGAYAIRAKDNDWVDSPKYGVYKLRPNWRQAMK